MSSQYLEFVKNNRNSRSSNFTSDAKNVTSNNRDNSVSTEKTFSTDIPQDDVIINDDNFISVMNDMYENIDKYIGRKIKIQGQVFKSSDMTENEFAIGKYYMYCCAVDMSLVGFVFEKNDNMDIKENEWYEVNAIIKSHKYTPYGGSVMEEPLLDIIDYKKIDKPKETTVY